MPTMKKNPSRNNTRKRNTSGNRAPMEGNSSNRQEKDPNKDDSITDDTNQLKTVGQPTTTKTIPPASPIEVQCQETPTSSTSKQTIQNKNSNSEENAKPCPTQTKGKDMSSSLRHKSTTRTDSMKSMDSDNAQGLCRTLLEDFADHVTVIGLSRMADHRNGGLHRLVWGLVLIAALTFTVFQVVQRVCVFWEAPITVKVNLMRNGKLFFPAVTLCSVGDRYSGSNDSRMADPSQSKESLLITFMALMSDQGHLKLLRCQWEQSTCTLANFTAIFTDMGLCFSFNVNGTLRAREAGRSYGLKLTLDTMQDDYLRSLDHYYGAGFRVVVHSPSVPPIMSERGVAVSPGLHNFLAIDVKHLKNAEPSVSHCGSKELRYYTGTYSTESCRLECRADYINETCGCRDTYMPNTHVRICDPPEFHSCIYPKMDEYLKQNSPCEDLCPEPCSENLYQVTPSSNPLSRTFLKEFSQLKNKSADYWSQNLLHLEIYLTSMTFEKVEKQLSYTLLQLFCDVGGAFGLLLGASILTLLEIADFFICRLSNNGVAAAGAVTGRGGRGGGGGARVGWFGLGRV